MEENIDPTKDPKPEPVLFDTDKHLDLQDIIVCLKRSEQGPMMYIRPVSRRELVQALGELQCALTREVLLLDEKAKKNKPQGTIIQAARNRLFRGKK